VLYAAFRSRWKPRESVSPSGNIPWTNLGLIVLIAWALDFAFLLVVPDVNWVVVPNVVQFNINQLPILILYFVFGAYAGGRGWFREIRLPGTPAGWLAAAAIGTAAYFVVGGEFFGRLAASNTLSPWYLLAFSFVRSGVLMVYLLAVLSAGATYFSRKNSVLHELAGVSYEIYLVHIFIVIALQTALAGMPAIPGGLKILITLIGATGISYLLGKFTIHKFPKASAAVMCVLFLVMPMLFGPD
jgi:hypothetical protein